MIELNGIQISDNNINTKKNVKIYVDEKQLDSKVGELSDLKTTDKSSIVNAINEIKDTTDTLQVDVNRIYSEFTIIPNTPTEQEFTYKQSNEGVIEKGVAVIDKVKGNSVVWNQLVKNATFINTSEWDATHSTFSVSGGIASVTASADGDNYTQQLVSMVVGHKYLYIFMAATDTANKNLACAYIFYGERENNKVIKAKDDTNWHTYNAIVTCVSNTYNIIRIEVTKVGTSQFKNISLVDLTQMFGAGNEPSTYEEFLSRKPKVADEYAYNKGTIVNNKVEKVVTTGRNLFDSSTAIDRKTIIDETGVEVINSLGWCSTFIPIIGGKSYFCKGVTINTQGYGVHCYDKDKQHIKPVGIPQKGMTFDAPINAKYIRIHGRYADSPANTAILNLSDASFNGQYAPYEKHELDLSWIKEIKDEEGLTLFPNGIESIGNAYDVVTATKAVKNIIAVDMGKLTWNKTSYGFYSWDLRTLTYGGHPTRCLKYPWSFAANDNPGTCGVRSDGALIVSDTSYSTIEDFISAMNGVMLYYESTSPIEVSYPDKNLTYPVITGGTEEAIVSEPSTAMRASITYGSNTVATILSLMNRVNELERKIIN